jgi:hypothetical protein
MASCTLPSCLCRCIAAALVVSLSLFPIAANAAEQDDPAAAGTQNSQPASSGPNTTADNRDALPDSPGAAQQTSSGPQESNAPASQQPAPAPQQKAAQRQEPVGTAAAGVENTAGIAASKPAGVAIAPPKQRRVRQLVIKLGVIAGAGAALGTVMALSKGSPSTPPGSR